MAITAKQALKQLQKKQVHNQQEKPVRWKILNFMIFL